MGSFGDIAKMLNATAARASEGAAKRARQAGLEPFVDAAQRNLAANGSNKTGALSASLGTADAGRNTTAAGPLRGMKHSSVGHLVEFGTLPHWQPNRGGGQMHPGAAAKPWARPAFEETKEEIVREAGRHLLSEVIGGRSAS